MIIVYPMLCSSTVNYSALPGIAKAMERYILLHKLDDVLKANRKQFKQVRGKIQLKEDDNSYNSELFHNLNEDIQLSENVVSISENEMEILNEQPPKGQKPMAQSAKLTPEEIEDERKYQQQQAEEKQKEEKKQKIEQVKDATTRVSMYTDALSLEPTWMYVDRIVGGNKVNDIVGIKVVPFTVQSDEKLVNLLMFDSQLKKLDASIVGFARTIRRKMYDLYMEIVNRIPIVRQFINRGTLKGDPRKDVLLAKSSFKGNVFVCVNKLDFEDELFQSPSIINRLFNKLGWGPIIAMDDSQKTVYFCVEEFKGVCFPINYGYIFSTLGKDHGKVFEDLNDVKKSSGGIFRRTVPPKKVFENVIYSKYMINPEVRIFSEMEKIILEKGSFEGKKESMQLIRSLRDYVKSLKSGDPKQIKDSLARKTKYKSMSEVKKDISKQNPAFKKGYDIGKNQLKNKIKFSKVNSNRVIEIIAVLCGIYALKDYVSGTMNSMKYTKEFSNKIEKRLEKTIKKTENKEENTDPDYILGLSCVITITLMIIPVVSYILYLVTIKYSIVQSLFGGIVGFMTLITHVIIYLLQSLWDFFHGMIAITAGAIEIGGWIKDYIISPTIQAIGSINDALTF